MRVSLIVAAGGSSLRFRESLIRRGTKHGKESEAGKLFQWLAGKPVLVHSLLAFKKIPQIQETFVAIAPALKKPLEKVLKQEGLVHVRVVRGGKTRAESVWNALRRTRTNHDWVMVHDGARPLVNSETIRKVLRAAKHADGVVLASKVVPTIKEVDSAGTIQQTVDRTVLREAETPQLVKRDLLIRAYRKVPNAMKATDEASLLELIGRCVKVITHEDWNPKITTLADLERAKGYIEGEENPIFYGLGFDSHKLALGRPFYLGGVRIPYAKGALGHSDGDALLHAITDAILGAIGEGDIGEWFSDRDPRWKNVRSGRLLRKVVARADEKGWRTEHVDSVIILQKPKLSPYKEKIRKKIASDLSIPPARVSVKAKTMEGLESMEGGDVVICEAIVSMRRK
ncbi:MAG: 2-C-methyl-D-erythritol 2,4-cyclodiphosphate synthase [Candidatus Omnitrophica bacterium]|nr:2-C-methyl-D-erythritol 2,4-cyclodiphosphate synthase [Candidatus Omnitrophota bacterium]